MPAERNISPFQASSIQSAQIQSHAFSHLQNKTMETRKPRSRNHDSGWLTIERHILYLAICIDVSGEPLLWWNGVPRVRNTSFPIYRRPKPSAGPNMSGSIVVVQNWQNSVIGWKAVIVKEDHPEQSERRNLKISAGSRSYR
jgi:hypothetical protein